MNGLVEFLLARYADDESWAQEALDLSEGLGETREWKWVRIYGPGSSSHYKGVPTPDRVVAECEAKRRIVELFPQAAYDGDGWNEAGLRALELLALPYADHPDYDEEWKP